MKKERFVSYAEYLEDLTIYNVLGEIKNGYYIDAGASDPWELSVTQAFYERGWRGINIEPRKEAFEDIKKLRPKDNNYCCGVGNEKCIMKFLPDATSFSEEVIKKTIRITKNH